MKLKERFDEVFVVEPNDLGIPILTHWYRVINRYFKKAPFIIVIPASFIMVLLLYGIFGYLIIRLATVLQYGF